MNATTCTACVGRGYHDAIVCGTPGCRPAQLRCHLCGGSGTVTHERLALLERGQRLRYRRVSAGLSQRELAVQAGITAVQLSHLEQGAGDAGAEVWAALLAALANSGAARRAGGAAAPATGGAAPR